MFIRYHLIFYAIAFVLANLTRYYHIMFILPFVFYLYFVFRRLYLKHFLLVLLLCLLVLVPRNHHTHDSIIKGKVIKSDTNSCFVLANGEIFYLYQDYDLKYGDKIEALIKYNDINENTNDLLFNEKQYLLGMNIYVKGTIEELISHDKNNGIYSWIANKFSDSKELSDYQKLFVFGEKTDDIKEDYKKMSELSIVHLFALSGMHISILIGLLDSLLGYVLYEKYSKIISFILVGIYVFSIPPSFSLQRAFLCALLQYIFNDYFNKIDILSFLVIVSLLYNPYILYNISFTFSYFVYFLVLITGHLKYSSLWIYVGTIPILLCLNYQLPVFSFFILFFIAPFVEYFYVLILLTVFFPIFNFLGIFCIYLFNNLMNLLDLINIVIVFSKPDVSFVIIFYLLYFFCIYKYERNLKISKYISMLIALMISFYFTSHYKIYAQVTMLDVGQGDCTLIRLPLNQGNILIDTGGSKDYDVATTLIIPYLKAIGIDRLDYVYISHDDLDHCGALESLTNNFTVENVIKEYEKVKWINDLRVEILKTNKKYHDSNDNSLIMYLTYKGQNFLYTGDISAQVEKDLYYKYKKLKVDYLKVAHHGSSSSSSPYLFSLINPRVAMIGVKKNNMYGHPSKSVINRLNNKNVLILRTDIDGMFHIRFYGKDSYIFR